MIISAQESLALLDKGYLLLDIREDYELELVPCPQANHLVMGDVLQKFDFFKADQSYIIVCKTGKRAGSLAQLLSMKIPECSFYAIDGGVFALLEAQNIAFDEY